jgi:D-amino acid aminotransferase
MMEHLQRMQRSMDKIGLHNPHSIERWEALCNEMIERTPHPDQGLYIQVTRGVAPRDHAFPKDVTPTVFMMSNPMRKPPPEWHTDGAAAITANDDRWYNNDIKSTALLGNVLARQKSAEVGAVETILIRDGMLTEASSSNVLIVKGGTIYSPPKSNLLLPGTTFDVTIELAKKHGMPHELKPITEAEYAALAAIHAAADPERRRLGRQLQAAGRRRQARGARGGSRHSGRCPPQPVAHALHSQFFSMADRLWLALEAARFAARNSSPWW